MSRAALALAGGTLLLAAPVCAQTTTTTTTTTTRHEVDIPVYRTPPAYWTQEQVASLPNGAEMRDRDAYKRQIDKLYQQHLVVYNDQQRKLGEDTQLLDQFRARFQGAKSAVAGKAASDIAAGVEPVDPNNGASTLTNADPLSPTGSTPLQVGNRDLATLENNVTIDRAALARSQESLDQYKMILSRL
jgi:hypothetical protein